MTLLHAFVIYLSVGAILVLQSLARNRDPVELRDLERATLLAGVVWLWPLWVIAELREIVRSR